MVTPSPISNAATLTHLQDPSYRIAPANAPKSTAAKANATLNSFGLHDTLTHGVRSIAADVQSGSGLRSRLESVRRPVPPHAGASR